MCGSVCSIGIGPANAEGTGITCCPHKGPTVVGVLVSLAGRRRREGGWGCQAARTRLEGAWVGRASPEPPFPCQEGLQEAAAGREATGMLCGLLWAPVPSGRLSELTWKSDVLHGGTWRVLVRMK